MSVARSAYRQLLRVGRSVADKYADPNDMCFALFGLLVTRHDFVNAGYGSTFPAILRTCFLRPTVRDDPHDTVSSRISAAFDALRRLNEVNASQTGFRVRQLRQELAEMAEEKEASTAASAAGDGASAAEGKKPRRGERAGMPSAAPADSSVGEEAGASAPPPSSSSTETASAASARSAIEAVAAATSQSLRAATSPTAPTASKTGSTVYRLDEGVDLIRGSVLIERSSRRRIQNFPRHCVVCEPISMVFPPYRFCVPPEPAYLLAVRSEFVLHGISDVLLALSATSILNSHNQHVQAQLSAGAARQETEEEETPRDTQGAVQIEVDRAPVQGAAAAAEPTPRSFPTTHAELRQLVEKISTHTVMQTDVLEVEVTTEYVCSNPASTASTATSSAAASTSSSTAALRRKAGIDGAFTTSTPLKSPPATASSSSSTASSSSSGSSSRRAAAPPSRESTTAGPGAPPAEDDDTNAHLFLYYVYIRNRGPKKNPHRWHAQVLSHHLVVVDVAQAQVLEMGRPGVMGNFPLLPPGASHCFESGTTLSGPEGILRGSIQVNLFNDAGQMVTLDAAIAPTRLTVGVTSAMGFTSAKNAKEELVQRASESNQVGEDSSKGDGV